jgi:Mrp family chromosome partitioning ATPase
MPTKLVCLTDPASPAAEAYRRLRVNLMARGRDAGLRSLLVAAVSLDAQGGVNSLGKASVVANLAVTFARVAKKVVLVDCDLRYPAQHTLFGLANQAGVTTVLQSGVSLLQSGVNMLQSGAGLPDRADDDDTGARSIPLPLQATDLPGLRVLTSGPAVAVPSELIASPLMTGLITRLCEEADLVLFDTPPVALATDAAELATQVDGVLLTISAGHTKREDARRAADLLAKVGATLVGAVLVDAAADAQVRRYLSTPQQTDATSP